MFKFMRFTYSFWLGLLAFNFILAACGPALAPSPKAEPTRTPTPTTAPTNDSTPDSHGNLVGGYVELVDALRADGATVEPVGSVEQLFFSVEGQVITVNGADVQVFEYADEAAREAESSLITPDGQPSPTSIVDWIAPPNFWAKGRVIVLYVGTDAEVIARLTEVLGDPITESATGARTYPEAVLAAINALVQLKGVSAGEITVVSVEAVEWRDSCLGVSTPGIACLQVITSGYRILLSAGGAQYEFHTNETGSAVRLVPQS
jgi:hypothetical protein